MVPALRYARISRITPASSMRFVSRSIRMSWLTRSKNLARSTATTTRWPDWTYTRAALTASCARLPGLNPWLCSLKLGSIRGCSTCSSACWIKRSSTVGMPSSRWLPSGLGIITLRTGLGRYVPASSAWRMSLQLVRITWAVCSMSSPSTPAAPLLAFTRFHAACRFCLVSAAYSRPPVPAICFADPVPGCSGSGPQASSLVRSRTASPCATLPRPDESGI